ncbi:hypothetical protein AVM48_19165 [Acinetobacter baumannii]|nr:hypothetical protein AVM48_19165 [Acinetobacter baumannii]
MLFEYVNTRRLNNLKLRGDMALDDMIDDRHELRLYSIDISATRDGACGTFLKSQVLIQSVLLPSVDGANYGRKGRFK